MDLKGRKVIVIGLARSGAGAANLLASIGCDVTVTDRKSAEELAAFSQSLLPSVRQMLGRYPAHLNGTDMIVVSPGVPLDIEPLLAARNKGIKIVGELEIAYQAINAQRPSSVSKTQFMAITGTNGKSTTTTVLDLMLKKAGFKTLCGGNIGNALSAEIYKMAANYRLHPASNNNNAPSVSMRLLPDYIVAEVSSFQLESIDEFKPRGAAILNISPDHMDRYHSYNEYVESKAAIFRNQDKDDFLVLNADDAEIMKLYKSAFEAHGRDLPKVYFFSRKKEVEGVYLRDGVVYCNIEALPFAQRPLPIMNSDEIRIKGVHNLENAMASSAMALLAGCPQVAVSEALRNFSGLEHRLEFVREINGVKYINDSKGTNVGAVLKSLEGFSEPIVLIAGGRDKAGDFGLLAPLVKEKVTAIVLIGEATEKMRGILGGLVKTITASGMTDAVQKAQEAARRGDVVLLSPACASFDMFRDFEDRGRQFKNIVKGLS